MELVDETLKRLYYDTNSPSCYAGIQPLWKEAKKELPTIKKSQVENWLYRQRTYGLYRPRRYRFKRQKLFAAGFCTDVHTDLADFQKLGKYNSGQKYVLVVTCVLSRRLWATTTKTKKPKDMKPAFERIFEQMPMKPHRCFSDRGNEFEAEEMKEFFKEHDIQKFASNTSSVKASMAERKIRQLKQKIYRWMSQNARVDWTAVLDQIVESINASPSRAIGGLAPNQINFSNAAELHDQLYGSVYQNAKKAFKEVKPKFKKGEFVRMSKYKGVFDRGYKPMWSDEIMEVERAKRTNPPKYIVKDERGEHFRGYYYQPELSKSHRDKETTYRIEKFIRSRTRKGVEEHLVKFFDDSNHYWIDKSHFA